MTQVVPSIVNSFHGDDSGSLPKKVVKRKVVTIGCMVERLRNKRLSQTQH